MQLLFEILEYIVYFTIAILGAIIHSAGKLKSLQQKAEAMKEHLTFGQYLKEDKWAIVGNFGFVIMVLFFVPDLKEEIDKGYYIKGLFAFVGYVGSDIAHRIFSAVNKRLNREIDNKTK